MHRAGGQSWIGGHVSGLPLRYLRPYAHGSLGRHNGAVDAPRVTAISAESPENGKDTQMADTDPLAELVARGIALARVGIGVGATLAPGFVSRLQFGDATPGGRIAVRMLGARDLALGVGALLAARHGSAGLRGWVEAGGFADGVDAWAFLRAQPGDARRRRFTALVAGGSAVVSAWAARKLGD